MALAPPAPRKGVDFRALLSSNTALLPGSAAPGSAEPVVPLRADERTKRIMDVLRPAVQAIIQPYEGRPLGSMPIQHLVGGALLKAVQTAFGIELDAKEFRRWVKFEAAGDHIEIKLNHDLIYEFREAAPNWVYALLWAFKPKFAPSFKKLEPSDSAGT